MNLALEHQYQETLAAENIPNSATCQLIINNRSLGDKFMEILKNGEITTVFQPIISLKDGKLLGYEALSRGTKKTSFEPGNISYKHSKNSCNNVLRLHKINILLTPAQF